jgi:mannosyltransferase
VLTSDAVLTLSSPAEVIERRGEASPRRGRRGWDGWIVAGFVVVAALLRIPTIGRAYWVDEGISIGISSHPISQIPGLLRLDGSPPLWYYLLHFWMLGFGSSPVATHTLSLLISLAVTPIAFWSGRALFGRPAAICAAALTATNPFLNWYATETRMYTLVVALSFVALTLALRAERDRSRLDAVGAVIAFAALDYTHNWGLYLTVVTIAYLAARAIVTHDRDLLVRVVAGGAGVTLLYLPWLSSFALQAANTAAPWAVAPRLGDFFADPSTVIGGTAGVVVAPVLAGAVVWTRRQRRRADSRTASILVGITLAVTVVGWVAAQVEPSWTVRYLAVTDAGWLLAAAGALGATPTGRRVVAALTVTLGAWSVAGSLLPDAHPAAAKDNVAAVAAAATPMLRAGDLVVVSQSEQVPVLDHYLPKGLIYFNPMGRVADPDVVDWTNIITRLEEADACATIEPAVAAAPVGTRVLEVLPLDAVGASGSAWSRAAHDQVDRVEALLGEDPALQLMQSFSEDISPKPYSPVIAVLFTKVSDRTSCG